MLEATSISGTAKAVLEFASEARRERRNGERVRISVLNFERGNVRSALGLTQAFQSISTPLERVEERRRFDTAVIPRVREIISCESPDVIWSNSVKSHFLVRAGKLHSGRKWVAFHHGSTTTNIKMRLYNELDRWSLRGADRVITVCQPFATQMRQRGVEPQRIRVQHMSIRPFAIDELDCEQLRSRLGLKTDEKVVLSIGRLSHEKGHGDLIRAFAGMRRSQHSESLKLILVGDGPERERLERIRDENSLEDSVLFTGHQDNVKPFYGIASVFVLPSYSEGSPNVLLEAMAARVPVVATRVGGVPELVQDGANAILVKAADEGALGGAILRIIEDDTLQMKLISEGCKEVGKHSPEAYYHSLLSIFEDTLTER